MFNKKEMKEFIMKYGKRWLFPDFTNKLTWFVTGLGATILATPILIQHAFYNWLIKTFNLNSGLPISLAELEKLSPDFSIGVILVIFALFHNIIYRYLNYIESTKKVNELLSIEEADRSLFLKFMKDFPSNSLSINLLRNHDFGAPYHENETKEIDNFVNYWNTAERKFLDQELELKRQELWNKCYKLVNRLASNSYDLNGGSMFSCIPDLYRGDWDWPDHVNKIINELNSMSTDCFDLHQELILLGRRKLKC